MHFFSPTVYGRGNSSGNSTLNFPARELWRQEQGKFPYFTPSDAIYINSKFANVSSFGVAEYYIDHESTTLPSGFYNGPWKGSGYL